MSTWTDRLDPQSISQDAAAIIEGGYLDNEDALFVHDIARMDERVKALHEAFGKRALHAIAVKANPVVAILERLVEAGAGLECASIEEVHLSLAAGCDPEKIVFDSPAKTREELAFALEHRLHLNLDNFDELERVRELIENTGLPHGHVGIRVNPQVGHGTISMTSVAGNVSKFGVPLAPHRERLLEVFGAYPWLDSLHVHVGSQGCNLDQLVDAVVDVIAFRDQAEESRDTAITHIDIGGGLPARYRDDQDPPELDEYVARLRAEVPGAFRDDTYLVTEFGRSIHATCGWAITRVEYVKHEGDTTMAVVHLGADAFMRPVYAPDDWYHDFLVLNAEGALKEPSTRPITLVGPLCFGGDILARDRQLAEVREGDIVVVRDAGAYTLATWSRHCSRGLPTVLGLSRHGIEVLKERERAQDVVNFWR